MALRAVPDHPKFADLKARLNQPKGAVLGWLEAIWHFTGRFTPQGNIGKYEDRAIEAWVEWNGEPGALIAALIASRWLDEDPVWRILVHDWAKHADKAAKNSINRSKEDFCVPTIRTLYPLPVPESSPVPESLPEPVHASGANPYFPPRVIRTPAKPEEPVNFKKWFHEEWAPKRGGAYRDEACRAWISVIEPQDEEPLTRCTREYVAGHEGPEGFRPDNFIFQAKRDGFPVWAAPKKKEVSEAEALRRHQEKRRKENGHAQVG
jgi:hypothetical protein